MIWLLSLLDEVTDIESTAGPNSNSDPLLSGSGGGGRMTARENEIDRR